MNSKFNPLNKQPEIENTGDNSGVISNDNSGIIVINQGMNYDNTKALCLDIVRDELKKYKDHALEEATRRECDLFNYIVEELHKRNMTDEQTLSIFGEPSMQYDYIEAQKAYIKAGTHELAVVLSSILSERIGQPSRTLLQIVLGESIQVAPKLIKTQMAALALAFVLMHTVNIKINNHQLLISYIKKVVLPIYKHGISQKQSEFQHLNFTGCSQYSVARRELPSFFLSVYAGLFMKGIDELPRDAMGTNLVDIYPNLFTRCLNSDCLLQVNAMSDKVLKNLIETQNTGSEHQQIIQNLFEKNKMSEKDVQALIVKLVPEMQEVFDYWKNSGIAHLRLTSVGIVIGAQYAKLITGEEYNLSNWI